MTIESLASLIVLPHNERENEAIDDGSRKLHDSELNERRDDEQNLLTLKTVKATKRRGSIEGIHIKL